MSDVVHHDFGKDRTESVRNFARLVGLVEGRHAEILADPVKHMDLAAREIGRLRGVVRDLQDAARPQPLILAAMAYDHRLPQIVNIVRDEYDRWKTVEAMLRKQP